MTPGEPCYLVNGVRLSKINGGCQQGGGLRPRGSHNSIFPTLKVKWSEKHGQTLWEWRKWSMPLLIFPSLITTTEPRKDKSPFIDVLECKACMPSAIKYNCRILFASCPRRSVLARLDGVRAAPRHSGPCTKSASCVWSWKPHKAEGTWEGAPGPPLPRARCTARNIDESH